MSRSKKLQSLIHQALHGKSADLWDLSELEHRPLSPHEHPGQTAIMLVREALRQFEIPSQVKLTYQGMKRLSGHGQHHLSDGVIIVNAEFQSLSGHNHHVDVPVIVHSGYMVFPEFFRDQQGGLSVMAQSAFDEMLRRGNVYEKIRDRRNIYSPHVESIPDDAQPRIQNHMFHNAERKQADHSPHGLDPAERDLSDNYSPGDKVSLSDDYEVRIRGGSRVVYPAGTQVTVIRDMQGDGYLYYCEFPDRRRAPVHYASMA